MNYMNYIKFIFKYIYTKPATQHWAPALVKSLKEQARLWTAKRANANRGPNRPSKHRQRSPSPAATRSGPAHRRRCGRRVRQWTQCSARGFAHPLRQAPPDREILVVVSGIAGHCWSPTTSRPELLSRIVVGYCQELLSGTVGNCCRVLLTNCCRVLLKNCGRVLLSSITKNCCQELLSGIAVGNCCWEFLSGTVGNCHQRCLIARVGDGHCLAGKGVDRESSRAAWLCALQGRE